MRRRGAASAHVRDALGENQMGPGPAGVGGADANADAVTNTGGGGGDGGGDASEGEGGLGTEYPDDPDDDAESVTSVATSAAGGGYKLSAAFFTTSEMEAMRCDMTRGDIVDRAPEIRDGLEHRHVLIEELLALPGDKWRAAVGSRPDLREADRFVRRTCKAAIGSGTDEAKIFKADERDLRRTDPAEAKLGRALLERIEAFGALREPAEIRKHKTQLKERQYLSCGETEVKLRANCTLLREHWSMLPEVERGAPLICSACYCPRYRRR
jgi:hypothetical protein